MKNFIELFGWYGSVVIVLGFALVSFSVISANSVLYQVLNATGALGIVIVSFYKKAYQPGFLNIIWLLIALVAIYSLI